MPKSKNNMTQIDLSPLVQSVIGTSIAAMLHLFGRNRPEVILRLDNDQKFAAAVVFEIQKLAAKALSGMADGHASELTSMVDGILALHDGSVARG